MAGHDLDQHRASTHSPSLIATRYSTGIPQLDEMLGGGLLPGTLTVVVGATGIGKTQLGLQFAHAGRRLEERGGIIFDVSARGDSQHHREYAKRMFAWELDEAHESLKLDRFFDHDAHGNFLHAFRYRGRRVTRDELDWDQWRTWQAELNERLSRAIAFCYGNFVNGARRIVFDGVEPADRPAESIQFELFEYVYHQILRKDPEWVARDLFRESYRAHAAQAARRRYDPTEIACLLLYTSHEVMLDQLLARSLDEGDSLSNANTLIYMGKIRDGKRMERGLHVAKHRGSAASDEIARFSIDDRGVRLDG